MAPPRPPLPAAMTREAELENTILDCMDRGLDDTAMWCAELLEGMTEEARGAVAPYVGTQAFDADVTRTDAEEHLLAEAVGLMQNEEYLRASHLFDKCGDDASMKAAFVSYYALWRDGDALLQQSLYDRSKLLAEGPRMNAHSATIYKALTHIQSHTQLDAYMLYLYALVLVDRGRNNEALPYLLQAVERRPLLWCAWLMIIDIAELTTLPACASLACMSHWVAPIFLAAMHARNYKSEWALEAFHDILRACPRAPQVLTGIAGAYYDAGKIKASKAYYEKVMRLDPFRLEGLDLYSNVLFSHEAVDAMSLLAHSMYQTDPYRPETQSVLGNLYSIQKDSTRAIAAFTKALQLNWRHQNAWTYLGHEYRGSVGNVKAALFCYHCALALDPKDFRAWIALAQIYFRIPEHRRPRHALYYAHRSLSIKPGDQRIREEMNRIRASLNDMTKRPLDHDTAYCYGYGSPTTGTFSSPPTG